MNIEAGLGFNENSAIWPNEQYPVYNLGRFDLDQDRSPDIACHGSLPTVQLLRTTNDGGASRLALRLVGTESNSHAVGARIKVHSGGKVQMKQVDAGRIIRPNMRSPGSSGWVTCPSIPSRSGGPPASPKRGMDCLPTRPRS